MKSTPGVLDFDSQRDASILSSFNPFLMFLYTNINPVMLEEIIIIIVIMGENPSYSHDSVHICRAHVTQHHTTLLKDVSACFLPAKAINRFVHVQCSCLAFNMTKNSHKTRKTMKMEISDALFFCIGHNWNRKYFSRKDFYFCRFSLACRWLPPDPWLGCVFHSTMPFGFFWSFSFLLLHVSATGENCRERYFHYALHVRSKQPKENNKKRGFSSLVVCFFFDNNSLK
jgi:hypothetical protein